MLEEHCNMLNHRRNIKLKLYIRIHATCSEGEPKLAAPPPPKKGENTKNAYLIGEQRIIKFRNLFRNSIKLGYIKDEGSFLPKKKKTMKNQPQDESP